MPFLQLLNVSTGTISIQLIHIYFSKQCAEISLVNHKVKTPQLIDVLVTKTHVTYNSLVEIESSIPYNFELFLGEKSASDASAVCTV